MTWEELQSFAEVAAALPFAKAQARLRSLVRRLKRTPNYQGHKDPRKLYVSHLVLSRLGEPGSGWGRHAALSQSHAEAARALCGEVPA